MKKAIKISAVIASLVLCAVTVAMIDPSIFDSIATLWAKL